MSHRGYFLQWSSGDAWPMEKWGNGFPARGTTASRMSCWSTSKTFKFSELWYSLLLQRSLFVHISLDQLYSYLFEINILEMHPLEIMDH